MASTEILQFAGMLSQGERELGAFLRAVADLTGPRGIDHAGYLWLQAMDEAGCPGPNHARFFRRITQQAAARLAETRVSSNHRVPNQLTAATSALPSYGFKENADRPSLRNPA